MSEKFVELNDINAKLNVHHHLTIFTLHRAQFILIYLITVESVFNNIALALN